VASAIKQLNAHGHQADVLTSMALADARNDTIDGVKIKRFRHFYPYFGLSSKAKMQLDCKAGNLFSFSLLKYLLSNAPPDVYHLHTGKRMGGIVRVAARRHNKPYVISLHGGVSDVPETERRNWQEPTKGLCEWGRLLGAAVGARRVLDDAAAILCVNRTEQVGLQQQYPRKRIHWTPNTVDVRRFQEGHGQRFRTSYGIPPQANLILNVARIDAQKNQLAAVDIFEKVAQTVPETWLALVGPPTDNEYAERLRSKVAASRHVARILCLGNVDSCSETLVDAYTSANAFLLTSIHEPFGIVLLEAWAAGVPIVASRVGGVPSFVDDEETGLLYSSGDIDAAARHVIALLSDDGLARRIRSAAQKEVERFDAGRAVRDLVALYEEVQREHPVRA
jgi:glycosyltransferase involved in cell wall biosynthesis